VVSCRDLRVQETIQECKERRSSRTWKGNPKNHDNICICPVLGMAIDDDLRLASLREQKCFKFDETM